MASYTITGSDGNSYTVEYPNQTPKNNILKSGVDSAKSAIRSMIPGGDITADAIPGLGNPIIERGNKVAKQTGDWTARNMHESPNLKTPLGNLNPKTATSSIVGGTLRPTSLVMMGAAPFVAPELAGAKGVVGDMAGMVKDDAMNSVRNTFGAIKSAPKNIFGGLTRPFTKIGAEITPEVKNIVSGRIRSMNPEALNAIGISPESQNIAKTVGERVGLDELPSKEMADKYYKIARESMPEDIQIPTNNLERVTSDPANRTPVTSEIHGLLKRTKLNELGTADKMSLSKQEYEALRGKLVNLDPTGENPAVQITKHALDADAGTVSPEIDKANGTFQVSRELGKANKYLDNPNLGSNLQTKLEHAGKLGNVQKRNEMSALIGDKAPQIFKDISRTQGIQRLLKVAGSIGLFGGGYKVFNALGGHHVPTE